MSKGPASAAFHRQAALNGQTGLFMPDSGWTALAELPSLQGKGIKRIGLDCETKDPGLKAHGPGVRRGAKIIGLSIAIPDGPKFYLPTGHAGGNIDHKQVMRWAKSELDPLQCEVVGAGLGYDLDFLAEEGITFPNATAFHDVLVAEPLLDENKVGSYNLEAVGQEHVGEGKDETLLMEAGRAIGLSTAEQVKSNLWRLHAKYVGPYAEGDADLPLKVLPVQMKKLEAEELIPVYEIERKLLPLLVRMRRRGVPVNEGRVMQLRAKLSELLARWLGEVKRLAGPAAELMEADSLVRALEDRGVRVPKTKTGLPSITKPMLERHSSDELVRAILNGRKVNTMINTFVDGQILGHLINGRVHPIWNQLKGDDSGTVGRLSGSHPNMQFVPARDSPWQEEALSLLVRAVFQPEDGEDWQRDDYSQIEYRFLVHYAVGRGADEARAKYNNDPTTSFHNMCADFLHVDVKADKNTYRKIKVTNFCKVYGGQAAKVADTFGCPVPEAEAFIETYDRELPFVRDTYEAADRWAKRRGYVVTILNRRQRFPNWGPSRYRDEFPTKLFRSREEAVDHYIKQEREYRGFPVRYVERVGTFTALCRKLQVSNADIMKKSMVDADEAGITASSALGPFLITVHDELGSSVPRTPAGDEAGKELTRIMKNVVELRVPILVDSERGADWGETSG